MATSGSSNLIASFTFPVIQLPPTHHAIYRGCFHFLVFVSDCLPHEDGADRLSETSVNKKQPKVHKTQTSKGLNFCSGECFPKWKMASTNRGDTLLDVYLVWSESSFTSCSKVLKISDHCGVLLEVEWGENCREHQVERLVPVYHKTNVPRLQSFLRGKFTSWATNCSCMEEIWGTF